MDGKETGWDHENDGFPKESDDGLKQEPVLETTYASPERFHKRVDAYLRYLQRDGKDGDVL